MSMKFSLFSLVALMMFASTGCGTLSGMRKTMYMIEAPDDLKVARDGTPLEYKAQAFSSSRSASGSTMFHTEFKGVKTNATKPFTLTIQSDSLNKSKAIEVKPKGSAPMLLLGIATLGIGTIVDLVTGGHKQPSPKYIDVKAYFNGTPPRSQAALKKYIKRNQGE